MVRDLPVAEPPVPFFPVHERFDLIPVMAGELSPLRYDFEMGAVQVARAVGSRRRSLSGSVDKHPVALDKQKQPPYTSNTSKAMSYKTDGPIYTKALCCWTLLHYHLFRFCMFICPGIK